MPSSDLNLDPRVATLSRLQAPLWVFDVGSMRVLWANSDALAFWGVQAPNELYARDMTHEVSDVARRRLDNVVQVCYQSEAVVKEVWTLHPNGHPPRTSEMSLSSFPIDSNNQSILVELVRDISDVNAESLHYLTALNNTASMISLYDKDYTLLYSNPSARDVLTDRWNTLSEILVNDTDLFQIKAALEATETFNAELEVNTTNGPRWHDMVITRTTDAQSGEKAILVSARDATDKRQAQQQAYNLAYSDTLTGLPNRAAMHTYMDELLGEELRDNAQFGFLFLDLDRFKVINDSFGHTTGDRLLVEVAIRLKKSLGAHGMVCRLGGDEFVAIIHGQSDVEALSVVARKILKNMASPLELNDHKLRITPSIGICSFPKDGNSVVELLEHADAAMYMAKARQSGYCFYDKKMSNNLSKTVKERLGLENDLIAATGKQQFELYYQPKISCQNLNVIGVEALIRWNHPTRGMVPPDQFISIAEENGQIFEIGNWVMDTAMKQQRLWQDEGLTIPVAINISPRQFEDDGLLANVSESLLRNRCDSTMIELEITESMLLGDADKTQQTLHQLSAMGIRLALDDFGTGYSNLAYLQKYPLDTLKIDRVFLADQQRSLLMSTILNMGKVLGLNVVAEGVETSSQADWLIASGCDQLQGFYFSRPLQADDATQYLQNNGAGNESAQGKAA